MKKKISILQCVLTVVAVVCLLLSNITVVKMIQLPFGFEISGALFIFPITYILSDVFSEVYGYKWSRFTCYLAFALNILMAIIFALVIASPGTAYFTLQPQLEAILGNTPRMVAASLISFVIGDLLNDKVFQFMKSKHKDHKGFGFRAIASSAVGAFTDTFIFYLIGFTGQYGLIALSSICISEMILKVVYELLILPVTRIVMLKISKYENNLKES